MLCRARGVAGELCSRRAPRASTGVLDGETNMCRFSQNGRHVSGSRPGDGRPMVGTRRASPLPWRGLTLRPLFAENTIATIQGDGPQRECS